MGTRVVTIPNAITLVRALMLVAFWYFIDKGQIEIGLAIFFISWALDAVDGYIARTFNQVSQIGSYFDKIIDRFTMAFGVIILLRYGYVPAYALLLFTREYGTLPVTYPTRNIKRSWSGAGVLGKVTTLGEGIGLLWLALGFPAGEVVVAAVALLGAVTAFSYLRKVFFIITLLLLALPAHAAGSVVINEVMWDGDEYIELANTSDQPISLENWSLTRQQDSGEEKTIIVFSADNVIEADSFFLIEKSEAATDVAADVIAGSALTLVNTGELVRLYDGDGVLIDVAGQLGPWPAGKNTVDGVAMERVGDDWQTSVGEGGGRSGTPRAANSIEVLPIASSSPSTTPDLISPIPAVEPEVFETSVVINEFLPNPTGDDVAGEFIELYNSDDNDSDISGWQLDDQEGGSAPYTLPSESVVSAHGFIVVIRQDSGIALNNTGDSVRLLTPDGAPYTEVTYEDTIPEGISVNRNSSGDYVVSTTVTAGSENKITALTTTPTATPFQKSTRGSTAQFRTIVHQWV